MKVNTKVRAGRPPSCGTIIYGSDMGANDHLAAPRPTRDSQRSGRKSLVSSGGPDLSAKAQSSLEKTSGR